MDGPTLDTFLDRARSFELSTVEYDRIADLLRTTDNDKVRFKSIMILRREGSRLRTPIVAAFVQSKHSGVRQEAMRFIIRDVSRADLCLDLLLQWLRDESEFGMDQLTALHLSGDAYRSTQDPAILREILRLLDHPEEPTNSAAAYSLVGALTPEYKTMTPGAFDRLQRQANIADYRRQAEELLRDQ